MVVDVNVDVGVPGVLHDGQVGHMVVDFDVDIGVPGAVQVGQVVHVGQLDLDDDVGVSGVVQVGIVKFTAGFAAAVQLPCDPILLI